jgi:DNA-binding transcriptional MerR regulator
MQAVHQNDLPTALALVDMRHAELASKRLQVEQTLKALQALTKQSIAWTNTHQARALRIGEAAKQVGVRTSALHFWEQQGLLHPARDRSSKYRIYDDIQMHRLQLIVLLRDARYDFDTIRSVLEEVTSGRPEKAIQAVEKRNKELARTSWACIEALSSLQSYIHDYCPEISSSFSIPKKE